MRFYYKLEAPLLLWLALGVALAAILPAVGALLQPRATCQSKCGDVEIPYPFGIGSDDDDSPDHCTMAPDFTVTCKNTGNNVYKPFLWDLQLLNISLQHGQARVLNPISSYCYNYTSMKMDEPSRWSLNLTGTSYRLSNSGNMFTVIGCRTTAYIADEDFVGKYMSGCVAVCRRGDLTTLTNGSCTGMGCCQTAIPAGLQYYQVWFEETFNTSGIYNLTRCSYAVLMESDSFQFSTSYLTTLEFNTTNGGWAPLVVDWAIGNETCHAARSKRESYACVSANSECFNSPNGGGYLCRCAKGFQGNPYLHDPELGCKDVNECTDLPNYPCKVPETCHNFPGGFNCICPRGRLGNAQNGTCERDRALHLGGKLSIGVLQHGHGMSWSAYRGLWSPGMEEQPDLAPPAGAECRGRRGEEGDRHRTRARMRQRWKGTSGRSRVPSSPRGSHVVVAWERCSRLHAMASPTGRQEAGEWEKVSPAAAANLVSAASPRAASSWLQLKPPRRLASRRTASPRAASATRALLAHHSRRTTTP